MLITGLFWNLTAGIDQIAINSEKGTLIVVGIVDPVVLANKLRKAGKVAEFISVGPYKKEDFETEKLKLPHNFPRCCKQCEVVAIGFPSYYQGHHDPCSILWGYSTPYVAVTLQVPC